jgi:hypothetical protein
MRKYWSNSGIILDFGDRFGSSAIQQAPEFESKPPSVGRSQIASNPGPYEIN